MTRDEVAAVREQLWDSGFRPVPLCNWNAEGLDEHLRGKKPLSSRWPELARENPPNCLNYPPVDWALNSGLLCDGLRAFDYDIDDADLAARCVDLTRARLGDTSRRCRQNSSRCLLLYRAAEGEPGKLTIAGKLGKIEVLGRGQQVVVHGVHASGVPLLWMPFPPWEIRRESLPVVAEDEVLAVLTDLMPLIGADRISGRRQDGNGQDREPGEPQADPLRIAAALDAIANDRAPDWEWWNRIGMAVWRATGGSAAGFYAFDEWSKRNPTYSGKETRARWEHYADSPPDQIGAGSVFHMANEAREAEALALGQPAAGATDPWAQPEPAVEEESEPEADEDDWPAPLALAAYHGLFGEAVAAIMPHTEADPAALLLNLLVRFGNKIGRGPHCLLDGAVHPTNLFVLICGPTGAGRKDSASRRVDALFAADAFDPWLTVCCQRGGLSSGEGLIHRVRDERWEKNRKGDLELVDAGVTDKRLLVIESEFSSVIAVRKREGSTLSAIIRAAWESGDLATMTRNNPQRATGALISIIAHTTIEELQGEVDRIDLANGFINRFLIATVRKVRSLPFGSNPDWDALGRLRERLNRAVCAARQVGEIDMAPAARALWVPEYSRLGTGRPGLLGAILGRGQPQVRRLAVLYALADQATIVEVPHLEAALALWRFCEDSARVIFGDIVGDPTADAILALLRVAGRAGMTRTELYRDLGSHTASSRIARALGLLLRQHRAWFTRTSRPGRSGPPVETWIYGRRPSP